ncbi:MAG: IS3 family transposase [Treponema sp.]|nr:IS3 family transposase [Treponema sp.]MBD5407984.1 IS3 family transposase [Treponema sp.]MBD5409882.1 IS3 family transposase [Treponema sp.]MBD5411843.1 IS3 family transposase [Treponema sp.]
MKCFFGRLKVEMFHGERFRTTDEFVNCLEGYIQYWNNERLSLALDGMRSVQYRSRQQTVLSFFVHLLGCILTTWAGFRLRRCVRSPRRRQIPFLLCNELRRNVWRVAPSFPLTLR